MPVLHSKTCLETSQHQIHYRSVPGHGKKREVQEQLLVASRWATASFIRWSASRVGLGNWANVSGKINIWKQFDIDEKEIHVSCFSFSALSPGKTDSYYLLVDFVSKVDNYWCIHAI